MAIDFVCGFECRIVTPGAAPTPDERHWDTSATGAAISTATVRSGTAALRLNPAGANMNIQKTIARTVVAGRFYIRIASMPTTVGPVLRLIDANGNLNINVDTDGTIKTQVGVGADSSNAATLTTNTWYRLDWLADSSSGTASMKLRVDGGAEVTATNAQVSANMTSVMVGQASSETYDIFYDDMILGTVAGDYPFGAGTVERMKPTRDGTHSFTANDFRYNAAGANIATSATDVNTYVDDDDLTSISDFIAQRVVRSTGYVEVGFGTAPFAHDALAVAVVSSWHASTTGANTVGLKMNDGGTLKNMLDEAGDGLADYSQTSVVFSEKILTAPPSGGTWTKAKLDAVLLRMGYATDVVGEPFWDGAMLEVAYAPAPGTNAPAELASGTGAAANSATSVKPTGGAATATGAANNAAPSVKPNAGTATGDGHRQ